MGVAPTKVTNLKIRPQKLYYNVELKGTELQIMRKKGKIKVIV